MAEVDEVARAAAAAGAAAAAEQARPGPLPVPGGKVGSGNKPGPVDQRVPRLDHHVCRRTDVERRRRPRVLLPEPERDGDVVLHSQVIDRQGPVGEEERDGVAVRVGVVLDLEDERRELLLLRVFFFLLLLVLRLRKKGPSFSFDSIKKRRSSSSFSSPASGPRGVS